MEVAAEVEAGVEQSGPARDTAEAEAGAVVQGRVERRKLVKGQAPNELAPSGL